MNTNLPANKNFLSPTGFSFSINKTPATNFFVQTVILPGVQVGIATQASPFVAIPRPGDKVTFGQLSVTFRVDEDMTNYLEIFNWIVGLGRSKSFTQHANIVSAGVAGSGDGIYSDASLVILTAAKNPNILIKINDLFPTSLTDLPMSTTESDVNYIEATTTFSFMTYDIELI